MNFGTIASGSSGNCIYIGTEETHILVDAGVSRKRIEDGLSAFGIDGHKLDAILITHEHSDHIGGLGVLSRKYHVPVYGTSETLGAVLNSKSLGKLDAELFRPIDKDQRFEIKDMQVKAFPISHDAANPVSYAFADHHKKVGMVTDLGYFDEHIVEALEGSDLLYVEANHDIRMVQAGPYPYYLKQRILGNQGHLCNEAAGRLIKKVLSENLNQVILGHLSKENNYPDLALEAVKLEVALSAYQPENCRINVAPRDNPSAIIHL